MTDTTTKKLTATDAIRNLAEKHGGTITPEIVLDEAKKKRSPLHNFFCWDDTVAANKYRLFEAAALIRRVKVTYHPSEDRSVKVRAYINVVEPDDTATDEEVEEDIANGRQRGIYVEFADALKIDSYRDQMVSQCKRDVRSFQQKYSAISEAAKILDAMEEFSSTVTID